MSFHVGGATTLRPFHSLALLRSTLIETFSELDFTHYGSIIAVASLLPSAWEFVHSTASHLSTWIQRFFIASITVPAGDPINRSVSAWVLENVIQPRSLRFHTVRTEVGRDVDPGASLKKAQRSIQYLPHWETAWFWHGRSLFAVSRSMESFNASMGDPMYDGIGGEELTVRSLGRSSSPIRDFVQTCREEAERKAQFYVVIYSRDRYGMSWKPKYRKPHRGLETVHFDEAVKRALLDDIRSYLDTRTRKLYQSRSIPYRRGYLLYGPPGTGKSSLSTALAGEFGLDLYEVKVPSIANDADLEQMFQEIPPRCIVLLEDIDAVWSGRETRQDRQLTDSSSDTSSTLSNVTLSGLLNVLDGVGSQEGRLVIMTTNKPEQLDPALVRPGRVDFKVFLGNISQASAGEMFMRMFSPELLSGTQVGDTMQDSLDQHVSMEKLKMLASEFAQQVPNDTFTPSQLQGFFQRHLSSARGAAEGIEGWVHGELAGRAADAGSEHG
ncbi:mitochondrial chaperone bcs1 like protein [Zymoseptoria brevis]|uniref:Mitochondrial chaperone bcs1 like protein n=1 Tax=Zymoseptoria brevis TaxID=1047168 RepID=A0A0F4GCU8_9PEZI|nr:mitochondrial chaperone bcs1 like protein [Zymoseptoria brevis]